MIKNNMIKSFDDYSGQDKNQIINLFDKKATAEYLEGKIQEYREKIDSLKGDHHEKYKRLLVQEDRKLRIAETKKDFRNIEARLALLEVILENDIHEKNADKSPISKEKTFVGFSEADGKKDNDILNEDDDISGNEQQDILPNQAGTEKAVEIAYLNADISRNLEELLDKANIDKEIAQEIGINPEKLSAQDIALLEYLEKHDGSPYENADLFKTAAEIGISPENEDFLRVYNYSIDSAILLDHQNRVNYLTAILSPSEDKRKIAACLLLGITCQNMQKIKLKHGVFSVENPYYGAKQYKGYRLYFDSNRNTLGFARTGSFFKRSGIRSGKFDLLCDESIDKLKKEITG